MLDPDDAELLESEMSFGDHLEELRSRIIRAILLTVVAFFVVFAWHEDVLHLVAQPYTDVTTDLRMDSSLKATEPAAPFVAYLKVSLIVALLVSAPLWMYQFWAFIGAGLYKHERRAVYKFAPPMVILFAAGVGFGYWILIPTGLRYLLSFADPTLIQNWISLSAYLTLFTTLTLVLGLLFQLPIIMGLLARLDIVGVRGFREKRRFFILGAFVLGALLTPPDAVTQVLMAMPVLGLYELGIFIAWFVQGGRIATIEWSKWRWQLIAGAVAIMAVAVSWGRISQAFQERQVNQKILDASVKSEGDQFPYFDIFRRCEWMQGLDPKYAFRFREETLDGPPRETRETWVVGDGKRSVVADVTFRSERINVTAQEPHATRALVAGAVQNVAITAGKDVDGPRFLGPLLTNLERASDADFVVIEALLAGLVGQRPPGLSAPEGTEATAVERETATVAWHAWWKDAGATWLWAIEKQR